MEALFDGVVIVFAPQNIVYVLFGTLLGLIFGLLPGLGAIQGIALLLPITFGMDPASALIILGGMYAGSVYSSALTSILINTPGDPTSAATILDGYPMARKGEGGIAIGGATLVSLFGSLSGILLFAAAGAPIARLSLRVGSPDYFSLAILGLVVIGVTTSGTARKGLISGGVGLMLSFVGFSMVLGYSRFTYGFEYLDDGLSFVALTVGMFAVSEAFILIERGGQISETSALHGGVLQGVRRAVRYPATIARGTSIGLLIGVLPGIGGAAANFIAYSEEQRSSKTPELFGTGHLPGVLAPEASNNAVLGASLIPTVTLGIPGSAGSALLLGGLILHGLRPGPDMFSVNASVTYAFIVSLALASLVFFAAGLLLAGPLSRVTLVPVEILAPMVIVLAVVAGFATRANFWDVVVAVVAGGVAYFMRKAGYSLIPLLIGFVLGPIVEDTFHRSMIIGQDSYLIFLQRPISVAFLLIATLLIVLRVRRQRQQARMLASQGDSPREARSD